MERDTSERETGRAEAGGNRGTETGIIVTLGFTDGARWMILRLLARVVENSSDSAKEKIAVDNNILVPNYLGEARGFSEDGKSGLGCLVDVGINECGYKVLVYQEMEDV